MKKFLFCVFVSVFMFLFLSSTSFASKRYTFSVSGTRGNNYRTYNFDSVLPDGARFAVVYYPTDAIYETNYYLISNISQSIEFTGLRIDTENNLTYQNSGFFYPYAFSEAYIYVTNNSSFTSGAGFNIKDLDSYNGIYYFADYQDGINYVVNGTLSSSFFDPTLKLDYFKCNTFGVLNYLLFDDRHANFEVGWSDSRIRNVKVDIMSTRQDNSFIYNTSPGGSSYVMSDYAQENGDIITLRATPYKADGSYGVSLYYSFTFSSNGFLTNNFRKLFKTNHIDNTIVIPYTGISGNDTYEVPVDGVGENICYEVEYNPVTNEYGDLNIYEIYYSPVVVYPEDTPQEVIDDTQEQIINNYTTNNYYETVNNFGTNVNFNYDDVSTNDIDTTYHDITGIFSGLANLLGKLTNLLVGLLPGLSPFVATVIIVGFGIIIGAAIIALIIKVVQVIADILPF